MSNLSIIFKVPEKVVDAHLERHRNCAMFYERYQSAYKESHSTESALPQVQNDILQSLDQGCVSVLILFDLSVTFDLTDYRTLLELPLNGFRF